MCKQYIHTIDVERYCSGLYVIINLLVVVFKLVVIFWHTGSLSPYDVTANTQHVYVVLGNRPVIDVLKVLLLKCQ